MRICAIRPDTFYGEGDQFFIPTVLRTAKHMRGSFPRIGNGITPSSYVGNVAWGHIKVSMIVVEYDMLRQYNNFLD